MSVIGFDFGTTNSLISLVQGDRVVTFTDSRGLPIPSVVSYAGSKVVVGHGAKARLAEAGLGIQGNIVRSPKIHLGQESIYVGGVQKSPVDVVRDVITYVRDQAMASRRLSGVVFDKAVATIPINMNGIRRAALRDAFRLSGMGIIQFVHEPLAALYAHFRSSGAFEEILRKYDRQLILVFDWGGGTLDITLCRLLNGALVQITNDGTDEVGGDVFDSEIRNAIVKRVRIERGLGDEIRVNEDARVRLMHDCERAKIDLSGRERVTIFVRDFFVGADDSDLSYVLSRSELESIVIGLLGKGLGRVQNLLDANGYTGSSVSLCLATGGMASMPAVRAGLHQLFGPERVHISERSGTLISEGAAWVAHDQARLKLAKNVELVLARSSYLPVVKAGTELPTEGDVCSLRFGLYCADPRDGIAKFQFVTPFAVTEHVLANDPRRNLETLTVIVDSKARPLSERLELNVNVDDNLILRAHGRSLNKKDQDSVEIHDLEFSLGLPKALQGQRGGKRNDENSKSVEHIRNDPEEGALVVRSNVAADQKAINVPGELLYQVNPNYFDTRRDPPEVQVLERLYYALCSYCQRPSNDPLCRCASDGLASTSRNR
jgi:molecular chaperone DnaK